MNQTQPTRKGSTKNGLPIAIANQVEARQKHAASCKNNPLECATCIDNARYFSTLTAAQIAAALESAPARRSAFRLRDVVLSNGQNRSFDGLKVDGSKRAERDMHTTAALIAFHKEHYPRSYAPAKKHA